MHCFNSGPFYRKNDALTVKGVGRVKAKAIVDYRNHHGKFKSVDELAEVTVRNHRLGRRFVEKMRGQFKFD